MKRGGAPRDERGARPGLLADVRRGAPRSLMVAAIVGSFLVIVNQGDHLGDMSPGMALRIGLTYATPFAVSMFGWLSASRASRRAP